MFVTKQSARKTLTAPESKQSADQRSVASRGICFNIESKLNTVKAVVS